MQVDHATLGDYPDWPAYSTRPKDLDLVHRTRFGGHYYTLEIRGRNDRWWLGLYDLKVDELSYALIYRSSDYTDYYDDLEVARAQISVIMAKIEVLVTEWML